MRIFLALLFVTLVSAVSISSQPALSLSESSFNFGKLPQHASVSHGFWIKSTGTDTLVIEKVVPGCGCTKAPLLDSVLAPGDSTLLEIIFASKSFRGFVAKRPYLETNISEEKVYLRIDTEIIPNGESIEPVRFVPHKLDVSQFTEQPRRKAKFHLENISNKDFDIKMIDDKNKLFEIDMPNKIKAGETIEGMITVLKDEVDKEFEQSFTIELSDEFRTRLSLPIQRKIRVLKK